MTGEQATGMKLALRGGLPEGSGHRPLARRTAGRRLRCRGVAGGGFHTYEDAAGDAGLWCPVTLRGPSGGQAGATCSEVRPAEARCRCVRPAVVARARQLGPQPLVGAAGRSQGLVAQPTELEEQARGQRYASFHFCETGRDVS